jgi:hypothetical protein
METLLHYIHVKWEIITAICLGIAGVVAFIKNIHQIKNLTLQNKKLTKEKNLPGTAIKNSENSIVNKSLLNLLVDFSEIIFKELDILGLSKDHLLSLLNDEFTSHPLLRNSSISYESTPVPLKNNTFVVISKRSSNIIVERISKEFPNKDIFNKWKSLCNLYAEAYRLPFRTEHLRLSRESVYNYSFQKIQELLFKLQEYIYSSKSLSIRDEYISLHEFKNKAYSLLGLADFKYKEKYLVSEDVSILGDVAVQLDLCISLVHKAILGYKIPQ